MNFNEAVAVVMQNRIDNQSAQYKDAVKTIDYYSKNILDIEDFEISRLNNALKAIRENRFKESARMVKKAEEHLYTTRREQTYITLYSDRNELLDDYDEEIQNDMIDYLDNQNISYYEPFVIISRSSEPFENSTILKLNEFDNHNDLLKHVDNQDKMKDDLYSDDRLENLTHDYLYASYANEDGSNDLEFIIDDKTIWVKNAQLPEDNTDVDYWEKEDNLKNAVREAYEDGRIENL